MLVAQPARKISPLALRKWNIGLSERDSCRPSRRLGHAPSAAFGQLSGFAQDLGGTGP